MSSTPTTRSDRLLTGAAVVFLAGFVLHNADHARRGLGLISEGVVWGGTLVVGVSAIVLTLIFTRHPLAPHAAVVGGFSIAFGVSATHLLPSWGVLSDSLPNGAVDGYTWLAVLAEVVGALVLGIAGLVARRESGVVVERKAATASR